MDPAWVRRLASRGRRSVRFGRVRAASGTRAGGLPANCQNRPAPWRPFPHAREAAMSLSRRHFLATVASAPALAWASPRLPWDEDPAQHLARLEQRHGGRLGVSVLDTGNGDALTFRAHDRFALCSTFKALLAAQVLAAVDAGKETL